MNKKSTTVLAILGAVALAFLLSRSVMSYRDPPQPLNHREMMSLTILALLGLSFLWANVVSDLSVARLWSPQWTFVCAALPFYIFGIWIWFFSPSAFVEGGTVIMLLAGTFGFQAGIMARKKAYPQLSDQDSATATTPPPTLFPK